MLLCTALLLAPSCRRQESPEYRTLLVGFDPGRNEESEREWSKLCEILRTNGIGLMGLGGITTVLDVQVEQEELARQLISKAFAMGEVDEDKLGLQLVSRPPDRMEDRPTKGSTLLPEGAAPSGEK